MRIDYISISICYQSQYHAVIMRCSNILDVNEIPQLMPPFRFGGLRKHLHKAILADTVSGVSKMGYKL